MGRSLPLQAIGLLLIVVFSAAGTDDFYSITATDINGKSVAMSKYKGKVLLIVNVASYCGYTDINYRMLTMLQTKYKSQGFEVLGFPCNQFGDQEPGSHADIVKFAKSNYDVNFRLFSKVNVVGEGRSPLYEYLVGQTGSKPLWNFAKYLIDRDGKVVQFFKTDAKDEDIFTSILYLLANKDEL